MNVNLFLNSINNILKIGHGGFVLIFGIINVIPVFFYFNPAIENLWGCCAKPLKSLNNMSISKKGLMKP